MNDAFNNQIANTATGCLCTLATLVTAIGLALLFCWPVMLLWNWLMPVFGLPVLTFWQMFGLEVLCNILFKSNVTVKQ